MSRPFSVCEMLLPALYLSVPHLPLSLCRKQGAWETSAPTIKVRFHCINDPVVSVENSRTLYRKLDEKNHSVEYYEIKDWEEHGGNIYFSETVLSIIQDFIKKTK